jgi:hypothetical protein
MKRVFFVAAIFLTALATTAALVTVIHFSDYLTATDINAPAHLKLTMLAFAIAVASFVGICIATKQVQA